MCPLCCVCHNSTRCCSRLHNWYAGRPRFGLSVFSATKCPQLFLVLSIHCVCCRFMGTSQNVRTGVWLAHKIVRPGYRLLHEGHPGALGPRGGEETKQHIRRPHALAISSNSSPAQTQRKRSSSMSGQSRCCQNT